MLIPDYKTSFKKDIAKLQRRKKDITKLISVACMLISEMPLPQQYENHPLKGNYAGYMDCHIEPDWLIIYKLDAPYIEFIRTGTHSDLF